MTRDEVIRLAREAAGATGTLIPAEWNDLFLERFAALVEASDTALLRQAWEALRQCEYTSAPAQRPMVKSAIAALQDRLGEAK